LYLIAGDLTNADGSKLPDLAMKEHDSCLQWHGTNVMADPGLQLVLAKATLTHSQ
jgi:hypothetical protein